MQTLPEDFIENKIMFLNTKINWIVWHSIADLIFDQADSHQATLCHLFLSEYTPAYIYYLQQWYSFENIGQKDNYVLF